jgi:hypothetical protein
MHQQPSVFAYGICEERSCVLGKVRWGTEHATASLSSTDSAEEEYQLKAEETYFSAQQRRVDSLERRIQDFQRYALDTGLQFGGGFHFGDFLHAFTAETRMHVTRPFRCQTTQT